MIQMQCVNNLCNMTHSYLLNSPMNPAAFGSLALLNGRFELQNRRTRVSMTKNQGGIVLTIRCSACKSKLWKYDKIGHGEVLRCHKSRISKIYFLNSEKGKVKCQCGKDIGIDKDSHIKMISKSFTYAGTKRNN